MTLLEKFQTLGMAASWDSCGGVKQKSFRKAKIPEKYSPFIHDCASTSENCKLVKVLQTNACSHDCKYCINSCSNKKELLEPEELARGFNSLKKQGFVQGLFLSSAVAGDADKSAERMIESARLLRKKFNFRGYIHLKALPTISKHLIFEMAELADRISLNLETTSKSHFAELGSTKDYSRDLEKRLLWLDEAKQKGLLTSFTTQFILGAAKETDKEVLEKMNQLYEKTSLHRAYFSAFQPVKGTALEKLPAEKEFRENQFYQTDWLLRVYGFEKKEIKTALDEKEMFGNARDIKMKIACANPDLFPVDLNEASKQELLRVPGIGPKATEKILEFRENRKIFEKDFKQLGIIKNRALRFLQFDGYKQQKLASYA
jgi:predicted DNA-binding helix-hairpin-helix protein